MNIKVIYMLKLNAKKIAEIVCSASNVVDMDIENIPLFNPNNQD